MNEFLIKICGVTAEEDAAQAGAAGADAIGVNFFAGSKRYIGDDRATRQRVMAAIPRGVLKVGVFVNAPAAEVQAAIDTYGLDRAQLHGHERWEEFRGLPPARLIRAVGVRDERSFDGDAAWTTTLRLYDAFSARFGGEGVVAPWSLIARQAAQRPALRFLLAGGLTPENVAEAVARTRPSGVDVATGVEWPRDRAGWRPGRKDPEKVVAFIRAARAAAHIAAAAQG
jgi:phosphoribosylanthranilate isomerase